MEGLTFWVSKLQISGNAKKKKKEQFSQGAGAYSKQAKTKWRSQSAALVTKENWPGYFMSKRV